MAFTLFPQVLKRNVTKEWKKFGDLLTLVRPSPACRRAPLPPLTLGDSLQKWAKEPRWRKYSPSFYKINWGSKNWKAQTDHFSQIWKNCLEFQFPFNIYQRSYSSSCLFYAFMSVVGIFKPFVVHEKDDPATKWCIEDRPCLMTSEMRSNCWC